MKIPPNYLDYLNHLCTDTSAPEHWRWLADDLNNATDLPAQISSEDHGMAYLMRKGANPSDFDAFAETWGLYADAVEV